MSSMSAMKTTRVGLVGCGAIAEIFHLPALSACPETKDAIVLVDTNAEQLERLANKFSVSEAFTDLESLVGKVDAVIVATPPTSHFAITKWCLEHGLHVLCEKPLTEDSAEAKELIALAADRQVVLAVNQTRRFFPTYPKIRELIQAGALGQLKSIKYHDGVEFDWPAASPHHFQPGAKGTWSDTGVHLLDTVCYWLDAKPTLTESLNDSHAGPEALATVRLEHEACKIEIKVSRLGRLMNGFEIVGSQGKIQADAEDFAEVRIERPSGKIEKHRCGSRKTTYPDLALPVLTDFLAACRGSSQARATAASTLGTIELLEEAYEAATLYPMAWNEAIHQSASLPAVRVADRPQRVLVTGASGFVGGRVVEAIQLNGLAEPIATIRKWSRAARSARFPVEIRLCDILDRESLDRALQNVDSVVHCAKSDDHESIVGGTQQLLDAAAAAQVRRLVFLSTAEVYGPNVTGEIVESDPTEPVGNVYADSKIEAEQRCLRFNGNQGLTTAILRPSLIHGPFSTSWSIDIAKRLLSGNWGKFDEHGEGNANLIYIDDLVQAILLCLTKDEAAGEAFNVNGPDLLTWNEYFDLFNDKLGQPPLRSISPAKSRLRTWAMGNVEFMADQVLSRFEDKLMEIYLRGGWASKVMKRIKGELNSTPSANELHDLFNRRVFYSDSKAQKLLGYNPQFNVSHALDLTLQWLHMHEIVPGAARTPNQSTVREDTNQSVPPAKELVS